jgi:predicted anti-sigma-YlaC factor YlaD
MNVTRDVITDLLPVYFSGEASEDTKRLMEEYFRENPEFERIARKAVMPLEKLLRTAAILPEAEREIHELQRAREEVQRGLTRKWKSTVFVLLLVLCLGLLAFFLAH